MKLEKRESINLMPTNECFTLSLEYIALEARRAFGPSLTVDQMANFRLKLVHGICRNLFEDGEYKRYSHAWVRDWTTLDAHIIGYIDNKLAVAVTGYGEYFNSLNCVDYTEYSLLEAFELNRKHNHYGPWRLPYMKLCRDYKPGMEYEKGFEE